MFNIGLSELLVVGVIALIFIGPQQLPEVARTLGRLLNELRRATTDFKDNFTADAGVSDLTDRLREARRDVHQTIADVRSNARAQVIPDPVATSAPEAAPTSASIDASAAHDTPAEHPYTSVPHQHGSSDDQT